MSVDTHINISPVLGTSVDEKLIGTGRSEVISGAGGNDVIQGLRDRRNYARDRQSRLSAQPPDLVTMLSLVYCPDYDAREMGGNANSYH